jgi:hypothetical protein
VSQPESDYQPSSGAVYGVLGVILVLLGRWALANVDEGDFFAVIGFALLASGAYALIVGGVARGIQIGRDSRRRSDKDPGMDI